MKRCLTIILVLTLLLLCGCTQQEETTVFYYLRSEFQPGSENSVIAPEARAVTGERGLNYTLRLYLEGPVSEEYASPFPEGLKLLSTKQEENTLQIYLSNEFASLENIDLTLACVCLARTSFELADVETLQIITSNSEGNQTMTLTRDSYLLLDTLPAE